MVSAYGLSAEQQDLVWVRWRGGESLSRIARSFGMRQQNVRRYVESYGGVQPVPTRRPKSHLSSAEREEISRGLAAGHTYRAIGSGVGRSHTTISREVARNGGRSGYRASAADGAAVERRRRPKPSRLATNPRLRRQVERWLQDDWSPQQISRRLRMEHPLDQSMHVSHECIYLSIYHRRRNALRRGLHIHLRSRRPMRNPKRPNIRTGRGHIKNMIPLSERPAEAESRLVIGHLEGDLVMGKRPSAVATLVDRSTREVAIVALAGGIKAEPVRQALVEHLSGRPEHDRKTLTWDRGREMAEHQKLTSQTGCKVFFCDPQSPWQRGSNENMNRLIRQYLPKSADLSTFSQTDLDKIAAKLNNRPREILGWRTPAEAYAEATGALTG